MRSDPDLRNKAELSSTSWWRSRASIGPRKRVMFRAAAVLRSRKKAQRRATFYNWRRKYGGMEVADAKRLKALEAENAKLKKMLAEQMMDVATLKEMLGKNF